MQNKHISLLLVGTILTGCTLGPNYSRPEFYEDQELSSNLKLNTKTQKKITADWYRQFQDKTLDNLVEQALQNSPSVNQAIHKLKAARYGLSQGEFQSFPMFDVDGSYNYENSSQDKSIGYAVDRDYYQLGLDATWELDIWGANRRNTEALEATYKAAGASFDNVKLVLISEIVSDYVNLRANQAKLKLAQKTLAHRQEVYDLVKRQYDNGLTEFIALQQAQYSVDGAKVLIPQYQMEIENYTSALSVLTGILPDDLPSQIAKPTQNLADKAPSYQVEKLKQLPVEVIRNRPDVQISEQNLIAQNAVIGELVANLYPNVSLSGFIGWQGGEIAGLIGKNTRTYSYSPAIKLPFFHWNQLTNAVEEQKEVKEEYLYAYQISILNAIKELRDAIVGIEAEQKQNTSYLQSVQNMKNVLQATLSKYENGLITFSEVLTAEQNLLQAQTELLGNNNDMYQQLISFYKAAGGGLENTWQTERKD